MSVKYIGRYTKKPVIAEARIISCNKRWVIFKFKDYAEGGKTSIKKMGIFTFITYLTQHIPDKYFRVVRGYGMFSNRLKGKLLNIARKLLNQPDQKEKPPQKSWRERILEYTGNDPLICEKCSIEMVLVFVCFKLEESWLTKLGINVSERIPLKQIKFMPDTG